MRDKQGCEPNTRTRSGGEGHRTRVCSAVLGFQQFQLFSNTSGVVLAGGPQHIPLKEQFVWNRASRWWGMWFNKCGKCEEK